MKFFPSFALRDLLLWLFCLMILLVLSVFLPYGPGIPGMEWELGEKADPFEPAFPGIKPEWYFLWEYQLLKEFPPHLFGLEGPQVCLFVVTLLLFVWAIIPWLDRQAARNQPSPAFSDFGWGAILFLTFLTLKAWDIGALQPVDSPASLKVIARTCAWWTVALGAIIIAVRFFVYRERWFIFSGAALLHVALHGLFGLSYLAAGAIAALLAAVAVVARVLAARRNKGTVATVT
jgi:quinol-cytochrome oxidoreductase complex cytochrome b subunit